MKIWILNHYAGESLAAGGGRHYYFSKYLKRMGFEPIVFCASSKHNSLKQSVIEFEGLWKEEKAEKIGVPFVFVKTRVYTGNGKQRVLNMLDFYKNVIPVAKEYSKIYGKPDIIMASSVHPLTVLAGIKLAKYFKVNCICEIRDLWPESIVAYGIASPADPVVRLLRLLEKKIYIKSDAIIFTMEGGYEYIVERGWNKWIPENKVTYINNGVDFEMFEYNRKTFTFRDEDLDDTESFKIIYTGSLRKANAQIGPLFEAVKLTQGKDYKFLIYGKGELEEKFKKICQENRYKNVKFKGFVDKKYIPYILSKCDVTILNCASHELFRYGGSQNKLFEYLASGKPIITGDEYKYSIVKNEKCGVAKAFKKPNEIVDAINYLKNNPISSEHIRSIARKYDFCRLTEQLMQVINSL